MLYAGQETCPVADAPYLQGDWQPPENASIMGAAMLDVCKDVARPAVVFTTTNSAGVLDKVFVWVSRAPIAAMEAELFYGSGPPSAFERRWLRDEASSIKAQRTRVGVHIHSRGLNATPQWLFDQDDSFHVMRPGAMTMLRLRKPSTDVEADALHHALEQLPLPPQGYSEWKILSAKLEPSTQVELITVFSTHGPEVWLMDENQPKNCTDAMNHTCISALALVTLKYARDFDYYNCEEDSRAGPGDDEEETQHRDEDESSISTVMDELLTREQSDANVDHLPPSLRGKHDTLAFALKATTKLNDVSKMCSFSTGQKEPMEDLVSFFFNASDCEVVTSMVSAYRGVSEMLEVVGRLMCPRQAILCVRKDTDSSYQSFLYTRHGKITIGNLDDVTRLLLCTWVTPLLLERNQRGSTLFEIKVQDIRREQLAASHSARLKAARNTTKVSSQVAASLELIPSLVDKLKDAEAKFEMCSRELAEAKKAYVLDGASRSGGSGAAVLQPVPPEEPEADAESETVRGFKRVEAAIDQYEAALRNVRQRR